jgi:hypothetical protein
MPNHLTWRRCTSCGQLTLVPASANVCWQCGAPCPDGDGHQPMGDLLANGSLGIEGPAPFAFGQLEIVRPAEYAAADLPAASSPARSIGLSSTDNETAHRLLTSVFPDGVVL